MKKYIIPVLLILFLTACSDDIKKVDSPSIQGETSYGFFHTTDVSAHLNGADSINDGGSITIKGKRNGREITLTLNSMTPGAQYELGIDSTNMASYKVNDVLYTTGTTGEGQVILESIEDGKLSGTFHFYAYGEDTGDTLSFSQGAFYNISFNGGFGDVDKDTLTPPDSIPPVILDCENATANVGEASDAYEEAQTTGSEEDIQEACQAYRNALEAQIIACGDDSGNIQQILDGLDCGDD